MMKAWFGQYRFGKQKAKKLHWLKIFVQKLPSNQQNKKSYSMRITAERNTVVTVNLFFWLRILRTRNTRSSTCLY